MIELTKAPVDSEWHTNVTAALNGQASASLRQHVPLSTRRRFGAFFTGTILSKRALSKCDWNAAGFYYDPTCGAGNLLLAAATRLPVERSLHKTLEVWGKHLAGTDLHSEFVQAAKIRLMLLAQKRHDIQSRLILDPAMFFPNIRVADALKEKELFDQATCLLMNPPFGLTDSPADVEWAGGLKTAAAGFVIRALEQIRPMTQVIAILPEVLRAGTFSCNWRKRVTELANVTSATPYGVFDESADVDVFIARLVRRSSDDQIKPWPKVRSPISATISDCFDVHVGRVVPHRDAEFGHRYPYIHPRCVSPWTIMREFAEKRKCRSTAFQPPFVVIRRTSRPGQPHRAVATVIAGKQPVAVENHLIVCEPKDRTLLQCMALMRQLKTDRADRFLDHRIRCRHLTVGAVAAIPFKGRT